MRVGVDCSLKVPTVWGFRRTDRDAHTHGVAVSQSTALSRRPPAALLEDTARARRRWVAWRQFRAARRGLVLAALVYFVVLSGAIPMSAAAGNVLLALATILGITRAARGIWAMRVNQHLVDGWTARRGLRRAPVAQLDAPSRPNHNADERAILALTRTADATPEGIYAQARARGLTLTAQMRELRELLADNDLTEVLRRPVAEALARTEDDLGALTLALSELSRADRADQPDLLERLAARLEVEAPVPAGLYAPA